VSGATIALERVAIGVASVVVSVALIALLSGFFASRDSAGLAGSASVPGQTFTDLGHRHLAPSQRGGPYDSDPPTSGPHHVAAVTRDQTPLSTDQLLEALELGNVVIDYAPPRPASGLVGVVHRLAPPFSPALAASGQAVILSPRAGTQGIVALAWAHLLRVGAPGDPRLRAFIGYWLGRGATTGCC